MSVTFSTSVISARLQAFTNRLDSDYEFPGTLKIYAGSKPSAGQPPDGCILLVTLTFPKPSLESVTGKTLIIMPPATSRADATGEVSWCRFASGGGEFVADADITVRNGGGSVILNSDSPKIFAGGEVSVTQITLQEP